ncbi:MAG: fibronectin type III domain-containing protein [Treponema sp.]|nr:fibronectin type III domain-containing protein [Treponema sp.]
MKKLVSLGLLTLMALSISAQSSRPAWSEVAAPVIKSVALTADNPNEITVQFDAPTDNKTSDKGSVVMVDANGSEVKNAFGKTRKASKHSEFIPESSGTYTFTVYAERRGEKEKHASKSVSFKFTLPLTKTTVSLLNIGDGVIEASWTPVKEAEGYILTYTDGAGKKIDMPQTTELTAKINGLKPGDYSDIYVTAVRGTDKQASSTTHKLVRAEKERVWKFTEFGTSTNPERNRMEMIDPNDLKFTLYSCIYDEKTGNIISKGGKFESFFDGISFYYTVVDPKKENFELTATVHIDYHNPMVDGQEGFGLLALDKLGVDGQPMMTAYNNSAGLISRKFTTHVNGAKKEIKNGLGARFVSGLTNEIIALGDAGIKEKATSIAKAFSYDQAGDAIKTGDTYRVTLKKDNTGYHAIYKRAIPSEDSVEEYIMYDNENEKLLQLDKEHIYVGFAVARGCNATFSDIVFNVTDPKTDPPAIEEPPELIPLTTSIDCPTTWYTKKYPFVFTANANGSIHIETKEGKVLVKNDKVIANEDYTKTLKIKDNLNDLLVTFDPEDNWRPAPKQVIAQYNSELKIYEQNYKSVTYTHSIISKSYKGTILHVSPNGNAFGLGTIESPLDLDSAIAYSKPGQTIILKGGTYYPNKGINIERGNNGTEKERKVLIAEDGKRAILDFSKAKVTVTAFNLYGNYWTLKNIDICHTPENVKGLQIAGNYNEILMVDAYENGDTGIQIAGRSAEPPKKWPHHNLVYGCESFGNSDPAQNNADGFASKLTSGEGNIFRNCVAHHNVDDGWDLYSKVETGPIGAVLLDNCITYANGTKLDGTGNGDGNGFKLGGDGIAIKHILRNSLSWGNGVNGITCNSNPALILDRVTAFGNGSYNITLYGKGKEDQYPRIFEATGVLSMNGGSGDNYREKQSLASDDNFFFNGAQAQNKSGKVLSKDVFVSVDTSKLQNGYNEDGSFNRLPRNEKGQFDLGDLFKLTDKVPANVGADYNHIYSISNAK